MRIGLYLGRHRGEETGMGVYALGLLFGFISLLEEAANRRDELVVYGDGSLLTPSVINAISLAPVLSAVSARGIDFGAARYFHALPNGARCQILVRLLPEGFGRKVGFLADQVTVPLWAWQDGVDLLHSLANISCSLASAPQVATVHDLFQGWPPGGEASWRNMFFRGLFRRQFKVLRCAIVDTPPVAQEVVRRFSFDGARIAVIPLGLDPSFSALLARKSRRLATEWREGRKLPDGYTLLLAGSEERKNLPILLSAWKRLPEVERKRGLVILLLDAAAKGPALELLGDERYEEHVFFIEKLPRHEMPWLFVHAGVVLVATRAEGFGLPALEAFAAGAGVVTGSVGSLDGIEHERILRCDPLKLESVSNALRDAFEVRGSGKPVRIRSLQDTARETWDVYRSLFLREGRR